LGKRAARRTITCAQLGEKANAPHDDAVLLPTRVSALGLKPLRSSMGAHSACYARWTGGGWGALNAGDAYRREPDADRRR